MNDSPASSGRLLRAVCVLLAAILIVTGLLKLDGLRGSPELVSGSASWLLHVVWAVIELAFGGWLLSGVYPRWTRLAALALFLTLLNVALSRALAGEASCGCLGRAKVSPWWAVAFDGVAVLLLAVSLSPSEAPRGRWWYAVAGVVVLAAIIVTAGMGVRAAAWHQSDASTADIPTDQGQLLREVFRGIERNESALSGLTFTSRLVVENYAVRTATTKEFKTKSGTATITILPHSETNYVYTVLPDGVKRVETGGDKTQELVRGQVSTELRPKFETAWLRPATPEPQYSTGRLDPATWGFYVPLARPVDWLAKVTIDQVERVSGQGRDLVRLRSRTAKGVQIVVDFDPGTNWLPVTSEQFSPDGSLATRTEVSYQQSPDRKAWLPQISTTWGWVTGKVRSADKSAAIYRIEHTVERVGTYSENAAFADIEIPEGYRVSNSLTSASEYLSKATQSTELAVKDTNGKPTARRTSVWPVVGLNFVLFAGFVIARRKLAL